MGSDIASVALGTAGVVALATALAWRQSARTGRKARLVRRFASPMAERRAQAGIELVDLGLARAARAILAHVPEEDDLRVRQEIALAIARRQWEPGGAARVVALRAWARTELEQQGYDVVDFGPAFTRLSDMGGPRLPEPESEPVAEPGPIAAPESLHWTPTAPADVATEATAATVVSAPQPS